MGEGLRLSRRVKWSRADSSKAVDMIVLRVACKLGAIQVLLLGLGWILMSGMTELM